MAKNYDKDKDSKIRQALTYVEDKRNSKKYLVSDGSIIYASSLYDNRYFIWIKDKHSSNSYSGKIILNRNGLKYFSNINDALLYIEESL